MNYLGNRHCAKFFAEEFLLKAGHKALMEMPNLDDKFIPLLQEELRRLQELFYRNKKKTLKPLSKAAKCCSIKCKSSGNLDTKNTDKNIILSQISFGFI